MKNLYSLLIAVFFLSFNLSAQTNHNVNAGNFYYTPTNLTVNVGDTVTWYNDGGFHDVNGDINSQTGSSFGNPSSFYLSAVQGPALIGSHVFTVAGNYEYDCSIGSHAQNGMVGFITVNSPPNTVYDIVSNSPDHTTLKVAVDTCSLDGTLSGPGPFT